MTAPTGEELLADKVRSVFDEVVGPMVDAFGDIQTAADEYENDDAAFGRRTREIIQVWAGVRMEKELAKRQLTGVR